MVLGVLMGLAGGIVFAGAASLQSEMDATANDYVPFNEPSPEDQAGVDMVAFGSGAVAVLGALIFLVGLGSSEPQEVQVYVTDGGSSSQTQSDVTQPRKHVEPHAANFPTFLCAECEAEVSLADKFCNGCGSILHRVCEHCKTDLSRAKAFCPSCGTAAPKPPR